jgi:hypothetical protein
LWTRSCGWGGMTRATSSCWSGADGDRGLPVRSCRVVLRLQYRGCLPSSAGH